MADLTKIVDELSKLTVLEAAEQHPPVHRRRSPEDQCLAAEERPRVTDRSSLLDGKAPHLLNTSPAVRARRSAAVAARAAAVRRRFQPVQATMSAGNHRGFALPICGFRSSGKSVK